MAGSKPRSKAVMVISPIGPWAVGAVGSGSSPDGEPSTRAAMTMLSTNSVPIPVKAAK